MSMPLADVPALSGAGGTGGAARGFFFRCDSPLKAGWSRDADGFRILLVIAENVLRRFIVPVPHGPVVRPDIQHVRSNLLVVRDALVDLQAPGLARGHAHFADRRGPRWPVAQRFNLGVFD